MITIGANCGSAAENVQLILNEHGSENLYAEVTDYSFSNVDNALVTWESNDTSVVTVDANGTITAISPGKATITAKAAGVSDSCNVNVESAPVYTDFSNATYKSELNNYYNEVLKINGVTLSEKDNYLYWITPTNTKPDIRLSHGKVENDLDVELLYKDEDNNYLYIGDFEKYTEYNQDLYLWVAQEIRFDEMYCDSNGDYIYAATKFVVEGKKITRAELPKLNMILKAFNIGELSDEADTENFTDISFNFPSNTEKRKFALKIGKVTEPSILSKMKNNDYTGVQDLLAYAKNNSAVYSDNLTTTSTAYYTSDKQIFDGKKLLEDDAYYYIYAKFEDEDGKYVPIECVTLGQAWKSSSSDEWFLYAYTSDEFEWDNLIPTTPEKEENENKQETEDTTTSPEKLPNTGKTVTVSTIFICVVLIGAVCYKKYKELKEV